MTIHRFYVQVSFVNNRIVLPKEQSQQITKVLRLKKGDTIVVFDGKGMEYTVQLDVMVSNGVGGFIVQKQHSVTEPATSVTLYQALTSRDKFGTILQKCTEIGIASFVPVETKRSLLKRKDIKAEKLLRWQRIVQEASEQSERGSVPVVNEPLFFEDALKRAGTDGVSLVAWEDEQVQSLQDLCATIPSQTPIALFIGPEGGFEEKEIEQAHLLGAKTISLGPRILRTETAAIVASSLILFSKNDL